MSSLCILSLQGPTADRNKLSSTISPIRFWLDIKVCFCWIPLLTGSSESFCSSFSPGHLFGISCVPFWFCCLPVSMSPAHYAERRGLQAADLPLSIRPLCLGSTVVKNKIQDFNSGLTRNKYIEYVFLTKYYYFLWQYCQHDHNKTNLKFLFMLLLLFLIRPLCHYNYNKFNCPILINFILKRTSICLIYKNMQIYAALRLYIFINYVKLHISTYIFFCKKCLLSYS